MEGVEPSHMLINGPYASMDQPLLVSKEQGELLLEEGYKVVTAEEYKKLKNLRLTTALARVHLDPDV